MRFKLNDEVYKIILCVLLLRLCIEIRARFGIYLDNVYGERERKELEGLPSRTLHYNNQCYDRNLFPCNNNFNAFAAARRVQFVCFCEKQRCQS